MKILYLDCGMGAAGDMLTAALLELVPGQREKFLETMNRIGLPGVAVTAEKAEKCGIVGTHIKVCVHGETEDSVGGYEGGLHGDTAHTHGAASSHHPHATLAGVSHRISQLILPEQVKRDMQAVYGLLAGAESYVHGTAPAEIHFHEVGTADAIADIAGVCLLLSMIKPDRILASPVHVGSGQVRCAHGILPVPAPATAYLLRGIPIYGGAVEGELCTPTGAALLKYFVHDFGEMPPMMVSGIGYGLGKKNFDRANCVRAMLGEAVGGSGVSGFLTDRSAELNDCAAELSCNLDDMTAEEIGFACERLLDAGALDVFTIPIGMKKSRPGTLLTCMCRPEDRERMLRLLFLHTTTLGIRERISRRYTLKRRTKQMNTAYGPVRQKISDGYGVTHAKMEYEDLARIARETGKSLAAVRVEIAFAEEQPQAQEKRRNIEEA